MGLKDFNNEEHVAHYTNLNRVVKDILPFNEIRISSASKLNDPYERDYTWIDNEPSCSDKLALSSSNTLFNLKKIIYNHIKLFSTTSYDEESKNCADLSLDIYARPRMWASYGDNHKGVCLIFNKAELSKEFNKKNFVYCFENKVSYQSFLPISENPVVFNPNKIKNLLNNPKELYEAVNDNLLLQTKYFEKHIDWKTEHEYRWLVFSEQTKDLNINFAKSLKGIVLGVDVDYKYSSLFKNYNIPLFKLTFEYGKYTCTEMKK